MRVMFLALSTLALALQAALSATTQPLAGTTEQHLQHGGSKRTVVMN
jgi:hypothetical protein